MLVLYELQVTVNFTAISILLSSGVLRTIAYGNYRTCANFLVKDITVDLQTQLGGLKCFIIFSAVSKKCLS